MTSSIYLHIAAGLLVAVSAAHSYLGEKYILRRLFKQPLPKLFGGDAFTKQTLRFAWHLTSIAWLGIAAILLFSPEERTLTILEATFVLSAILAFVATRGKHLSWLVFLAIAALCWMQLF